MCSFNVWYIFLLQKNNDYGVILHFLYLGILNISVTFCGVNRCIYSTQIHADKIRDGYIVQIKAIKLNLEHSDVICLRIEVIFKIALGVKKDVTINLREIDYIRESSSQFIF